MPKSDTWPGGVAMESLSNLDSAGSCDSVISMNSAYSEDSMEHLSAEERACLMYLEETIEALEVQEVQEDSGLSNDEPDPLLQADKMGRMRVNDISNFKSESGLDQKSESGVLTVEDNAELHALNHTSEPQHSPAKDFEPPMNLTTPPTPPVTDSVSDSKIHPTATELCVSTDEDGHLKIVPSASLDPGQSPGASDVDVVVIPPPSDFMDKPRLLPPQPLTARDLLPCAGTSNHKPAPVDLELLHRRASSQRGSASSSVTQEPPNKPPELRLPAVSAGPPLSPPPEAAEPRSPPAVAPKPKKLPANIILKSHKAAGPGTDGNSGHLVSPNSDRVLLDPQRVRMEALRKLGLLPADADLGPALSPKHSPKSRRSWAAPASPISPAAPYTPPSTPSTPSYSRVHSPPPASVPVQSPAAVTPSDTSTVQPADILPAPPAFSDPEPSASEVTVNTQVNTPPLTPPFLVKHLTPPKVTGVKSATLERSGLRSSQQGPSQLRNTRARPASLGSGKEFSSARGDLQAGQATSREPDVRRSLPAFQHAGDSQKLPRSQGISVLICPRAENGENRREALKKLGLLRD